MPDAKSEQQGRERVARVFRYLKALNEHRNPAKRDLSDQPWTLWFRNLPDHPLIERHLPNGKDAEDDDFILKVGRPTFTQGPPPPLPIQEWLEGDWEDADAEVLLVEAKGDVGAEPVRFDTEPRRVETYERWRAQHDGRWREAKHRPAEPKRPRHRSSYGYRHWGKSRPKRSGADRPGAAEPGRRWHGDRRWRKDRRGRG